MEEFKQALANYLAKAVAPLMGSDEIVGAEVALALLNNHEEEWELPTAEAWLADMLTDEVLKQNQFSDNENVKKFIAIVMGRRGKQLV